MAPGPSSDRELSFQDAEAVLLRATSVQLLGLLPNSSNYTFLARLATPGTKADDALAVYKPAEGESPLWDFPAGSLHRREVAAYRFSRFLGWPLIPPTVTRPKGPMGAGSLQLFIQAESGRTYFRIREERTAELLPIALFDILANNADRKAGHHLLDEAGRLWVIDHGLTFHADQKLRTVIWEFAGERLPRRYRGDLERTCSALESGELATALKGLVSARELLVLRRRVEGVLDPGWRFPSPSSALSVPWPPV